MQSAEPQGLTNGITPPARNVSDEDMLSETECDCLACSRIGARRKDAMCVAYTEGAFCKFHYRNSSDTTRRSADETCTGASLDYRSLYHHERSHYRDGKEYICPAHGCEYKSSVWSELTRHTLSVHCQNPPIYSCPEIGCQYHGDNGFKRKDKLKSHIDKVHHGRVAPGRPGRRIEPAADNANNGAGYRA